MCKLDMCLCKYKGAISWLGKRTARMDIYGIDFTSSPSRRKPLTCARCRFEDGVLTLVDEIRWTSFDGFDAFLSSE